jgi:uncharacterized protein YndB with AHSA1/START domain
VAAGNNASSATEIPHRPANAARELLIERTFDAPRSLVFKVWTQPQHIMQWWGPKDFTVPLCQMDFRTGGAYRACIVSPEGKQYVMRGVYREILEPERIVFTFAWEETGERGMQTVITVDLADVDGGTRLRFHQAPFQSASECEGHLLGWSQAFDRLEADFGRLGNESRLMERL